MNLQIKEYYNIFSIKSIWKELYSNNEELTPFQDFDYAKNIFKTAIIRKGYVPYFVVIYNQDTKQPILIIPLMKRLKPQVDKQFYLFGDIQACDITDFIYSSKLTLDEMKSCIKAFRNKYKGHFVIRRLREDSLTIKAFKELLPNISYTPYTYVRIPPQDDIETYINSLSKSMKQNIRTAYNRLNRDGKKISIELLYPVKDAKRNIVNDALRTYIKRQITKYNNSKLSELYTYFFYFYIKHDTISLKHNKNGFISVLKIDDTIAGVMMGFEHKSKRSILFPRLAINDEMSFYSPGIVLIIETLRNLLDKTHINCIDLTRGNESYKYKMGGIEYYTYSFLVPEKL